MGFCKQSQNQERAKVAFTLSTKNAKIACDSVNKNKVSWNGEPWLIPDFKNRICLFVPGQPSNIKYLPPKNQIYHCHFYEQKFTIIFTTFYCV